MSPDNLPTYISLNQAATRYGVNVAMLRRAVESGIIRAVKINEEVMVANEDVAAQIEMNTDNLPIYISLNRAAEQYNVTSRLVRRAVEAGVIKAVKINEKVMVADEDVAVVAAQVEAKDKGDELVSISEAARKTGISTSIVWEWYRKGWLPLLGNGPRRAILVSLNRAKSLSNLREKKGKRGRRLIPRGQEIEAFLNL